MKVFKFIPPYNHKTLKPNFPSRGKSGVYIVREEMEIVYVGYSGSDLYKTMYRHFQAWNHPTQEVVSYANGKFTDLYKVRVVYCTPKQAEALEKALIKKYKPRDNAQKYEDTLLKAYDRNTLENYQTEQPETPKFSKRELEVLEDDKKYFEERANQSKAIFGIEHICKYCGALTTQPDEQCYKAPAAIFGDKMNRKYQIRVFDKEQKEIRLLFPIVDTLEYALKTYKELLELYQQYPIISLEALHKS